jgi:outer membrane protein TolC
MRSRNRRGEATSLILAAFLVATAAPLVAERKINADEAVALAIANNESLKQSAISLSAKRRALGLSWNELLPSLSASAGLGSSAMSYENDFEALDASSLAAQGSLTASLSLSPALGESRKSLRLDLESELIVYGSARTKLELQVRKKVYAILLDKENLTSSRQNIERESQSYAQTEARYKAGLASELDLLSAKVSLAQLGPTADAYANILANDLDSLKNTIGIDPDEEISVEGSLELADEAIAKLRSDAKAAKSSDNRDVAAAAKTLELASSTKKALELSKLWPALSLSASVAPSDPLTYSGTSSSAKSLTTSASAMVSIELDNLVPGSSARESIAQAQDSIDKYEIAYRAAVKDAEASRKSNARSVESYQASLKALKLNAELAQQSYDASMKAYKNGLLTLTSLQSAAGDLESAKLSALSKSYDLIAAALDLAYETGLPLDSIGKE